MTRSGTTHFSLLGSKVKYAAKKTELEPGDKAILCIIEGICVCFKNGILQS